VQAKEVPDDHEVVMHAEFPILTVPVLAVLPKLMPESVRGAFPVVAALATKLSKCVGTGASYVK
jgi:hypothetical protein